jgi:hypothetical protein
VVCLQHAHRESRCAWRVFDPSPAGDFRIADRPAVLEEKEVLMAYFAGGYAFAIS